METKFKFNFFYEIVTFKMLIIYPKKQSISFSHFCKKSNKTERPLFWTILALSKVCNTISVLHHKPAIITCRHMVLNSVLIISRLSLSNTICKKDGKTLSILLWHWSIIISSSLAAWLSASSSSTLACRT